MNQRTPKRFGLLMVVCFLVLAASTTASATTHDFKYLQEHSLPPSQAASDGQIVAERLDIQDAAEKFCDLVNAGGPAYNSAESMGENIQEQLAELGRLSMDQRVHELKKLGMDQKAADTVAMNLKSIGKDIGKYTKHLDKLDKLGTISEAAGALAGGDAVGAGQATVNSLLSSAAAGGGASAGAWLGVKIGATYGAAAGPAGAAVGGSVGAVGGAVLGSYIYDWQGKPVIDAAADRAAAHLIELEEQAEKSRRRLRADFMIVYPNGVISAPDQPLPPLDEIHRRAQAIRQQRKNDPLEQMTGYDECPQNPEKTKPGLCGCSIPDIDSDGDRVPDCMDECPQNPKHYQKGPGGCSDQVPVPHVIGKPVDKAVSAIAAVELSPAVSGGDPAPSKEKQFTVQSQSPEGGTPADIGSPVSIRIHSAYQLVIPNVIGLAEREAKSKLLAVGLEPVIGDGGAAPTAELSGKVKSQSPPDGQTVTLTVYKDFVPSAPAGDDCPDLLQRYLAAMGAEDMPLSKQILAQSRHCGFYAQGAAAVQKSECLNNGFAFLEAMKSGNHGQARALLAASVDCDFHNHYAQNLNCSENLNAMSAALQANDINRYRTVLAGSQNCGFFASLSSALSDAERQAANQRQQNQQLAQALGQVLGNVIRDMAAGSGSGSAGSGSATGGATGGRPSGPPVVKYGTCNDVRKAGANQPERHIMDLGSGGKTFVFEYETYTEEDRIIVTQGSGTLFDSGCVGTHGRKSVRLKKGFQSEVTVDVRPNCANGTNTQWEFIVHCPD